jgi:hypothetical protein
MLIAQLISQLLPPRFFLIFRDRRKLRNVGVDRRTCRLLAPVLLFPLPGDEFRHLEKPYHKIGKGFQEMWTELLLLALTGKKIEDSRRAV